MSDFECPKCKAEHEATGSHEDDAGEQACDACGFVFIVQVEYSPTYDTFCAVHEWSRAAVGMGLIGYRCVYCGTVDPKRIARAVDGGERDAAIA